MSLRYLLRGSFLAALLCLIAACGGGGSAATTGTSGTANPPVGGTGTPGTIQGIATPESVAVVTATHATN